MKDNRSLSEIIKHRLEKLEKINSSSIKSFKYSFKNTTNSAQIFNNKDSFSNVNLSISGRIVSLRKMGKACFAHVQDNSAKIQVYIKTDHLPENVYDHIVRNLDIGDIVGVEGRIFYTKTNELTIDACDLDLLAKNIRPLPNIKEKDGQTYFAFQNKELRYRNRHLDLITNPSVKNIFLQRAKIIKNVRNFLDDLNYIEVETPALQPIYGGANAKPFTTFHNTLSQKLYLRIASELYLKRLIVGGMNKVYEISKNFRNEGMDKSHNPEFTMLEFYESYSDVNDMMKITEQLFNVIKSSMKKNIFKFNNHEIDFSKAFKVSSMKDLFIDKIGENIIEVSDDRLDQISSRFDIDISNYKNRGKIIEKIFSQLIEPHLIQPTFVIDYPIEISPLARKNRKYNNGKYVERFELFIGGIEIANAFSELNDPFEQRKRLSEQQNLVKKGDDEAQVMDEDFIKVLETGMPPTGGVGIGVDRLVMIFTEQDSIKDVILFPSMRPEQDID
ncbi:MAG: lysine--tRNA ligase [Candidatus Marinimicrobia bacterium]|nr:lysine--tRNA ligase [Candidatus Neomarinimicrobiota bacterium]|tara:strand:+ start:1960 stop:3462 length:1503 start_codon:yes stop_codon:yes gene_type:complete